MLFGRLQRTDYGRRGINTATTPRISDPGRGGISVVSPAAGRLKLYYALADRISRLLARSLEDNLTLVNADWTGRACVTVLGIKTTHVISAGRRSRYRACMGNGPQGVSRHRPHLPEKEYERVMRILARRARAGADLTLTIVGTSIDTPQACAIAGVAGAVRWVRGSSFATT